MSSGNLGVCWEADLANAVVLFIHMNSFIFSFLCELQNLRTRSRPRVKSAMIIFIFTHSKNIFSFGLWSAF